MADARYISPVERLLYLQSTNFGNMPPEELASIAQLARERSFGKGAVVLKEGAPPESFHILAEGRVVLRRDGRLIQTVEAPGTVGLLAIVSQDPRGIEAIADTEVVTLELSATALLESLEDNFQMMENLLRGLSGQVATLQRELELRGQLPREAPAEVPYPHKSLDLVRRLLFLRSGGPFRTASLDAVTELARRAEEKRYEAGDVLWEEGEGADYGLYVFYGTVLCASNDGSRTFRLGPGSVVGFLEAYGRQPRSYRAVAETRLVVLSQQMTSVLDVLEDNVEIGFAFAGFLAKILVDLNTRMAKLKETNP